jgi:predicted DNA-binding ribbon-helix-helix protein
MGFMKKKTKKYKYNQKEWDETKSVVAEPRAEYRGVSTSIRLSKSMIDELRKIAKRKGDIGYQTLLKIWIAERLEEESHRAG